MLTVAIRIEKTNWQIGLQLDPPGGVAKLAKLGPAVGGKYDGTFWGRAVGA